MRLLFFSILAACFFIHLQAQDSLLHRQKIIRQSILLGGTGVYTTASLIYLNQIWYKPYASSNFHFFNDNSEWCQMDKCGHTFTTYNTGRAMYKAMRWAGFDRNQSILMGELYGTGYMTAIEIMDGFSSGWGFSWGDEIANVSGSALFALQQYLWDEQRIGLKFSFHQTEYPNYRPDELGTSLGSQIIKDYNGQNYWLSANIASFLKKDTKFPKWINVALGYGAEGMISGNDGYVIINSNGTITDFYRYRKYYLSLDVDLTKIKTKSVLLRSIFSVLNTFKIPFPALEADKNGVHFKPFYF